MSPTYVPDPFLTFCAYILAVAAVLWLLALAGAFFVNLARPGPYPFDTYDDVFGTDLGFGPRLTHAARRPLPAPSDDDVWPVERPWIRDDQYPW